MSSRAQGGVRPDCRADPALGPSVRSPQRGVWYLSLLAALPHKGKGLCTLNGIANVEELSFRRYFVMNQGHDAKNRPRLQKKPRAIET